MYLAPATPPEIAALCQQLERRYGKRQGVVSFATRHHENGAWTICCQTTDCKQRPTALSEIIAAARPVSIELAVVTAVTATKG